MDAILLDGILDPDKRQWAVLAIGMIAVTYLMFRPRFRKKDPLQKPAFTSLSSQRVVERQMQNLLVELSEMARQISAQLDTRAGKLELLIKHADERISQLGSFEPQAQGSDHGGAISSASPVGNQQKSPDEPALPDPRHADIYSLADQGRSTPQIAQALGRPSGEVELILALRPRT